MQTASAKSKQCIQCGKSHNLKLFFWSAFKSESSREDVYADSKIMTTTYHDTKEIRSYVCRSCIDEEVAVIKQENDTARRKARPFVWGSLAVAFALIAITGYFNVYALALVGGVFVLAAYLFYPSKLDDKGTLAPYRVAWRCLESELRAEGYEGWTCLTR